MTSSKRIVFNVGGDDVDLTNFAPLTMGDRKALKKLNLDSNKLFESDPEQESQFILFVLQKERKHTTMEEIDAIPSVLCNQIVSHVISRSYEVDGPLSTPSTPSDGTTGGEGSK